jgi:hypothetical protein
METEPVPETLVFKSALIGLIAPEDFIKQHYINTRVDIPLNLTGHDFFCFVIPLRLSSMPFIPLSLSLLPHVFLDITFISPSYRLP